MCLAVVALDAHPRYRAGRSPPIATSSTRAPPRRRAGGRAAVRAVLAGRDLEAGGTWLGVRARRPLGARHQRPRSRRGTTRGALARRARAARARRGQRPRPPRCATSRRAGRATTASTCSRATSRSAHWGSNRAPATPRARRAASTALSNALLDTPWPKLERTTARRARRGRARGDDRRRRAVRRCSPTARRRADDALPATGVPLEWERLLSAPFIVSERYGTRCSTVLPDRPRRPRALPRAHVRRRTATPGRRRSRAFASRSLSVASGERRAPSSRCGMPASTNSSPSGTNPKPRVERHRLRLRVEHARARRRAPRASVDRAARAARRRRRARASRTAPPCGRCARRAAAGRSRSARRRDPRPARARQSRVDRVPLELFGHVLLDDEHRDAGRARSAPRRRPVGDAHGERASRRQRP